jgi:hypothetical protein
MDPTVWDELLAKLKGVSSPTSDLVSPGPASATVAAEDLIPSSTPIVDAWESLLDKLRGSPSDEPDISVVDEGSLMPGEFPAQKVDAPADPEPVEARVYSRDTRREFLRNKIERELNKRRFIPSREAESIAYLLLELEELEDADEADFAFIESIHNDQQVFMDAEVVPLT